MSTLEDLDRERVADPSMAPYPEPQAALYAALAAAQGQFPPLTRDRTVKVKTRDGGTYSFSYATLQNVLNAVRPALAENGLAVTQLLDGASEAHTVLRTQLIHAGGGMVESAWPISSRGTPQEFGSALTYLRRYTLVALLGIASEEDDDGNHASGNTATATQEGRSRAPRPSSGSQDAEKPREAPTASEFDRDKAFKAAKAIERKLKAAGMTDEQWEAALTLDFGHAHVSDLTDEELQMLVAKLREAEKALPKEKP